MTIPTDANDTIVYTLLQESVSAMFNTSAIEVQWRSISQLTGSLIFARIIAGNEVLPWRQPKLLLKLMTSAKDCGVISFFAIYQGGVL
ncbi:MAG TPA: hypothetical protein GX530_07270 [Corynebacteriales bacterium]|nr:hypothetical protein [Mycobacteriales bacterium]